MIDSITPPVDPTAEESQAAVAYLEEVLPVVQAMLDDINELLEGGDDV